VAHTGTDTASDRAETELPKVRPPKGPPPKRLVVKDLRVGTGAEAKTGDTAAVQYIGLAYKTGKEFDRRSRSEPFFFQLGAPGQAIPGWEMGVPGMKVGGRRELIVPPRFTFDELGKPETLIYVLELLSFEKGTLKGGDTKKPKSRPRVSSASTNASSIPTVSETTPPKITVPHGPPPQKLVVKDLREGTGKAIKRLNDKIAVEYVAVEYRTGNEPYNTWQWPGRSRYHLWENHKGWELGLMGMKVGGRRELIVPPRLAYGRGTEPLIYVIDLFGVKHR